MQAVLGMAEMANRPAERMEPPNQALHLTAAICGHRSSR